jgi:two-component system, cell cycle response regulator
MLFLAALIGGWGVFALHTTLGFGGGRLDGFFQDGVYNALMLGAAAMVIARGMLVREDRAVWLVMGAGLLSWSLGELYYSFLIEGTGGEAGGSISPADALYLMMYPCFYVGLGLLCRGQLRDKRASMWLDGLIAGLGAASVTAALILPPILHHATGVHSSIVVSIIYPVGDLLLMLFALGAIGITGWRPSAVWVLIAAGMLISAIADSIYLYQTSTDSFQTATWLECLWPCAAILLAIAAWMPTRRLQRRDLHGWQVMAVPALALLSALAVLVYGNLGPQLTLPALILASAAVLAVGAHLVVTWRENVVLLIRSERLSLTDPLTGLGNRRRLMGDLWAACKNASTEEPWGLVLYDLDGFKLYNDSFGHPAGDTLLVRLSERLKVAVEPHGTAYRMGGDEFCVLFDRSRADDDTVVSASVAALSEDGYGFSITTSHGVVRIPVEMSDPASVMQLADQRLYRCKEEVAAAQRMQVVGVPVGTDGGAASPTVLAEQPLGVVDEPSDPGRSADAHNGDGALPFGERHRGTLARATPKQGARDRRVRRQPPL